MCGPGDSKPSAAFFTELLRAIHALYLTEERLIHAFGRRAKRANLKRSDSICTPIHCSKNSLLRGNSADMGAQAGDQI